MFKKIFFLFLTFFLCGYVFASSDVEEIDVNYTNLDQYLTIGHTEADSLIRASNDEIVGKIIRDVEIGSKESDALFILKAINNNNTWKTLMVDAPLDATYMIGKEIVNIVKILNGGDISEMIGKVEDITVNKSIEYLMDELFENEIRIKTGAIEGKYELENGEWKNISFQYILALKAINNKESQLTLSFFSPQTLEMPKSKGGLSLGGTYSRNEKINPFIVTINSNIFKEGSNWKWNDETIKIDVEFPEDVPDFGFKKTSFWERNILEPIKEKLAWFKQFADIFAQGSIFDIFSSTQKEQIENNEELSKVTEKILEVEEELVDTEELENNIVTEAEFQQRINELNQANQEYSNTKQDTASLIVIKENMTDSELKIALIKIYKELVDRKKQEAQDNTENIVQLASVNKEPTKIVSKTINFCSNKTDEPQANSIIINEIAWMGTDKSAANEWIELKNISTSAINLKNYQLIDEGNQIKVLLRDYVLEPGGFYLLERISDETIPTIIANQVYTGVLSNSKEGLYLFNSSCQLEDSAIAVGDWPAGDKDERKSMERKDDLTWQTYSGTGFGSPASENSDEVIEDEEEDQSEEDDNIINLPSTGGGSSAEPSYCPQTSLSSPSLTPVIINEIAWMGTAESSTSEWIELKNITDTEVSLEGYQLLDKDNQISIIFTSEDTIAPNGYYLLERTDDNTVSGITADKIYVGALSNTDESLRLFNSSCSLIDQAIANPDWVEGNDTTKKSMERKDDLTWQTYSGDSLGTPRAENSEGEADEEDPEEEEPESPEEPEDPEEPSYCPQTSLSSPSLTPVIINEIGWMGTAESSTSEWIELKNITDTEVSLEGYQLLDKDNQISIIFTSEDTIAPNGYYLLERTDDNTVSGITADKIYVGALSNTDESLRLFNSSCSLIDQAIANPDWVEGNDTTKKSMERKDDLTWQTYSGDSFGTPRAENSTPLAMTDEQSYCINQGYTYIEGEEINVCIFDDENQCEATSFYNGTCGQSYASAITLDHLVITEIQDYSLDEREYIRLFNQTGGTVSLNEKYIVYYSLNDNNEVTWNNPNSVFALSDDTIEDNNYYQIDFTKDNRGDIKIAEDGDYFYANLGSICLMSADARELTEAQVQDYLIDCVGWEWVSEYRTNEFKEGTVFRRSDDDRLLAIKRKQDQDNQLFFDRDNNYADFEAGEPSIKTLPSIENLSFEELEDKTTVNLKWDYLDEDVTYKIYYSENSLIDIENLQEKAIVGEIINNSGHVEAVVGDITEGVDYRFKVMVFENDSGNTSELSEVLFYVYYSQFDQEHLYANKYYDINETNKTSFTVGQEYTSLTLNDKRIIAGIDFDNNIYILAYERYSDDDPASYYILYSYDENGKLRWKILTNMYGEILLKDNIYLISDSGYIKAYSYNGLEILSKNIGIVSCESAKIYQNKLYFYGSDRAIKYIDLNDDNKDIVQIYTFGDGSVTHPRFLENNIYLGIGQVLKIIDLNGNEIASREFLSNIEQIDTIDNDKILIKTTDKNILLSLASINEAPLFESAERLYFRANTSQYIYFWSSAYSVRALSKETYLMGNDIGTALLYMAVVDGNNNVWVKCADSKIRGYEVLEDATLTPILESASYSILSDDIILLNNKIYFSYRDGMVELSF
jgi:putative hemolysin